MWVIKAGDAEPLLIDDPTLPYWRARGYQEWQPDGAPGTADGAPDADVAALFADPDSATSSAARAASVAAVGDAIDAGTLDVGAPINLADSAVSASAVPRFYTSPWNPGTRPPAREPDTTLLLPAFSNEEEVLAVGGRLAYSWPAYFNAATSKAQIVPGPYPSVSAFTGNAQGAYAVFPLDGVLEPTSFTVEFWVRSVGADFTAQAFTTAYTLLAFDGTGAQTEGLAVRRTAAGTLVAALSGPSATITASLTIAAGDVPADTWVPVSVTYDGTTLRLTLGANTKSATATGSPAMGSLGSADTLLGGLLINPGTAGTARGTAATPANTWQVTAPHVRRYPRTAGQSTVTYHPGMLVDATVLGTEFRRELTGIFSQYYGWKDALPDGSGGLGTSIRDKAIAGSAGVPLVRIDHVFDKVAITDRGAGQTPRYTYDWSSLDEPMDRWVAASPDVRFVITLGYTPTLLGATRSTPPTDNALFAQMCSDAVAHWLAKGYKLAALPLWNEPSLGVFWTGTQAQMQALWVAVAQRLNADYGTNALVPKLGTPDDIGTFSYQNGVLTAAQTAGLTVGSYHLHDYSGHPRNYRTNISGAKAQLTAVGMGNVGVWVTEWNDHHDVLEQIYTAPLSLSARIPDRPRQLRHGALCLATVHEMHKSGAAGAVFTRLTVLDDAYANVERTLGAFSADDPPRPLPSHATLAALWKLKGATVPVITTSPALRGLATWDSTGKVLTAVLGSYAPVRAGQAGRVAVQWANLPPAFTWKMWRFTEPDVADGRLRLVSAGDETNLPQGVDLGGVGLYVVQLVSPTALPEFVPEQLPGLVSNFDASSITGVADGAAVASWPDSGTGGQPLAQATAGKRPTFVQNARAGRPAVRFASGSSQTMVAAYGSDPIGTGAYTLVGVLFNNNSDGVFTQYRASGNGTPIKGYLRGANIRTLQRNDANSLVQPASSITNNGVWQVVSLVWDGATLTLRANGVQASQISHTGVITTNRLWVGSDADAAPFVSGDIAKLMAFGAALDAATVRKVERALAARYDITIAT